MVNRAFGEHKIKRVKPSVESLRCSHFVQLAVADDYAE